MKKEIKRVCIVNNLYCLLIYLLLTDVENDKDSFYFFADDIPDQVLKNFPNSVRFKTPISRIKQILFLIKLRFLRHTKYTFLKTASIYGQDNLLITSPLVGSSKLSVLEDGLASYVVALHNRKLSFLKSIIGGPFMRQYCSGLSPYVERIFLTGLSPVPEVLKPKVEIISLNYLWDNSSVNKKNIIESKFNLNSVIINKFREIDSILLTQPLSEDNAFSEEEKIQLFRNIIGDKFIAIKPHPRERTDYKNHFVNTVVLEPYLPIELLSLIGIRFSQVYTVFSTAALALPGNPTIHFLGTGIHPALVKKWGDIKYVDGRIIKQ